MEREKQRSWAEIDLEAIKKNLQTLTRLSRPDRVFAVVKADAYGHGMIPVVRMLADLGVGSFCVASLSEAAALRDAGFTGEEILVFGGFQPTQLDEYARLRVLVSVNSLAQADAVNRWAARRQQVLRVHLKFNTGMNRYGISLQEMFDHCDRLFRTPGMEVSGVYSHLANAGVPSDPFTMQQIIDFTKAVDYLELNNIWRGECHLYNSAGIIHYSRHRLDDGTPLRRWHAVRPGLSLYGYYPSSARPEGVKLRPALTLKSRIVQMRRVAAGESVGYDRAYRADREMQVALLPIGYADGYSTCHSNRGLVQIGRALCPVVGRVCMDTVMVDVSGVRAVCGQEAVLWGGSRLPLEECADRVGSIPYELTSCLTERVPRIYG